MIKKKRVTFILGTRPEAIKLAPLIKVFQASEIFYTRVVLTGQHEDMVQNVFELFDIKADVNLKLMKVNQTLNHIVKKVLEGLEIEFNKNRPNLIFIQGDTSTAFASSLAAFYSNIPIAHVEAGLRTNNLFNPFPEEGNRRLISTIADLHFAPTKKAYENLLNFGINKNIFITGNTVVDALVLLSKKNIKNNSNFQNYSNYILVTIHRRENWGKNIIEIANAFLKLVNRNKNLNILLPLHPNPKVRDLFLKILGNKERIILSEPLGYKEFVFALKDCTMVLTDSGGIQEEAPSFGKPVLVLRKTTERTEGVEAGTSKLIGTRSDDIVRETEKIFLNKEEYNKMSKINNPYGDGNACKKIFEKVVDFLNAKNLNTSN